MILIYAEKAFGKIQEPFTVKILTKQEIEGIFLNLTKNIYEKSLVNILMMKY